MKFSFLEEFLTHAGKSKRMGRILTTVCLSLAVVVFVSAYLFVSQNAITIEADQMDRLEQASDLIVLEAPPTEEPVAEAPETEIPTEPTTEEAPQGDVPEETPPAQEPAVEEPTVEEPVETPESVESQEEPEEELPEEPEEDPQEEPQKEEPEISSPVVDLEEPEITPSLGATLEEPEMTPSFGGTLEEPEASLSFAPPWMPLPSFSQTTTPLSADPVDFSDNITSMEVLWHDGSQFSPLPEGNLVDEGDRLKVTIFYAMAAGDLTDDQNVIYYELTDEIGWTTEENGVVLIDGETNPVGTYTITEDGRIEITFTNPDFEYTDAFSGNISFEGYITSDGVEENRDIKLSDDCTLHIEEERETVTSYDLNGSKDAQVQTDGTVDYTIHVSSTHGTSEEVFISDILEEAEGYVGGAYSDFHVTKTETGEAVSAQTSINNGDPSNFTMTLPQLGENEGYTITYTVTPDGSKADGKIQLFNSVLGSSGNNHFEDSVTTTVQKSKVAKTGTLNQETGNIEWTITLDAGEGGLNGYQLTDAMTLNQLPYTAFENIQLQKPGNPEKTTITLPYTFVDCPNEGQYIVTYTTKLLPNQSNDVKNTATLTGDGDSYVGTANKPGLSYTSYGLEKTSTDTDLTDSTYNWQSTVTIPENGNEIHGEMVYSDELVDIYPKNSSPNERDHFTTVEALRDMIVTLGNGTTLKMGIDYTISCKGYAGQNNWPEYNQDQFNALAEDSDVQILTFALHFREDFLTQHLGETIAMDYDSYINTDWMDTGVTYNVQNRATVGSKTAQVEVHYRKDTPFTKLVSTKQDGPYQESLSDISYNAIQDENGDAILCYQIKLSMNMFQDDTFTLTDILPEGAALLKDSVDAKFEIYKTDGGFYTSPDFYLTGWYNVATTPGLSTGNQVNANKCISATVDPENHIQFAIINPNQYADDCNDANFDHADMVFTYKIKLPEPGTWENIEQDFTNKLTYGSTTVSNTVTVVDTDSYLAKVGAQDETDKTKAHYSLVINESKTDLRLDKDTYLLKDTLNTKNNLITATLVRDSVKLYRRNADGTKGDLVSPDIYSYTTTHNGTNYEILMELPDTVSPDETISTYVLEYTYNIYNPTGNTVILSNSALLEGENKTQSKSEINFIYKASSASVSQDKVTLYKYEEGNEGKSLQGATFEVARYVDGAWVDVGTYKTEANGETSISFADAGAGNYLYRLKETIAPSGYGVDLKPKYFVWTKTGTYNVSIPNEVNQNQIIIFSPGDSTLLIPNSPKDSIAVWKKWYDSDHNEIAAPADQTIRCQIHQYVNGEVTDFEKIFTLSSEGETPWTLEFKLVAYHQNGVYGELELPMSDATGNRYSYSVSELDGPDGFQVAYVTDVKEGIPRGDLVIENIQISYTLPETGGLGTAIPMVAGLLLITLATTCILHRKKRTT